MVLVFLGEVVLSVRLLVYRGIKDLLCAVVGGWCGDSWDVVEGVGGGEGAVGGCVARGRIGSRAMGCGM